MDSVSVLAVLDAGLGNQAYLVDISVLTAGPSDWAEATGYRLEVGG